MFRQHIRHNRLTCQYQKSSNYNITVFKGVWVPSSRGVKSNLQYDSIYLYPIQAGTKERLYLRETRMLDKHSHH